MADVLRSQYSTKFATARLPLTASNRDEFHVSRFHTHRLADDRFAPILLKKSKIARLRKSLEGRFFVVSVAASLCRTSTRTYDRFSVNRCGPSLRRAWDAPAALENFVRQPKRTFSTVSASNGLLHRSKQHLFRRATAPQFPRAPDRREWVAHVEVQNLAGLATSRTHQSARWRAPWSPHYSFFQCKTRLEPYHGRVICRGLGHRCPPYRSCRPRIRCPTVAVSHSLVSYTAARFSCPT